MGTKRKPCGILDTEFVKHGDIVLAKTKAEQFLARMHGNYIEQMLDHPFGNSSASIRTLGHSITTLDFLAVRKEPPFLAPAVQSLHTWGVPILCFDLFWVTSVSSGMSLTYFLFR